MCFPSNRHCFWLRCDILIAATLVCGLAVSAGAKTTGRSPLDRAALYNVVWDSPSKDYSGSMPLGNGEVGVNAWVEASGDVLFYIGKTDSWDENGRLLKVGRVRVSLSPRPSLPLAAFRQTLNLPDGTMLVSYGCGDDAVTMRLWVDANYPAVHLEVHSTRATTATAALELWRTSETVLPAIEVSDVMVDWTQKNGRHGETVVEPDSLIQNEQRCIGWFHANHRSTGPVMLGEIQGVKDFPRPDPLLGRVFGGVVTAAHGERIDASHLESPTSCHHAFDVYVATSHPATSLQWRRRIAAIAQKVGQTPPAVLFRNHVAWWKEFWSRSWINLAATSEKDTLAAREAFVVGRGYALQRYLNACGGRGTIPIKFNGSIFTVPSPGGPGDADYRRWGPGFWWQNTRLPYYAMCAAGDYDLMMPLFRMYGRDLMPLFTYRTHRFLNHDGAYIPECIYFWGDMFSETYGWTPCEQRTDKLQENLWHKREWVSGLELVQLMLEYYHHSRDAKFVKESLLPVAHEILLFFDEQYPLDANGNLNMTPSQAAETWWECTNPMTEIAGLHAVTEQLLALPATLGSADERRFWIDLEKKLPALPVREFGGRKMVAPAGRFDHKMNVENPELYCVFPFRLISFEKPTVNLALEALNVRGDHGNSGWRQDDVFMAYLRLADSARQYLVGRAENKDPNSRFPAFWGPNYDWTPDQTHGAVLMKTLQGMLMQTDGKKIFLLPAWPKDWNVEFKLHAPLNTVVEGSVEEGRIATLHVSPASRKADVVVLRAQ